MQITKLLRSDEERAVSPVIGVILMVAITVILAAVIGTFVLGLGDQVQTTAPNHNFDTEAGDSTVTFSSSGGQSVDASNLAFQASTTDDVQGGEDDTTTFSDSVTWDAVSDLGPEESVSAGDSVEFESSTGDSWDDEDSITLVWQDEGQSSTMTTWEYDG